MPPAAADRTYPPADVAGLPDSSDALGLESRIVKGSLRTDYDIGRVYRLISAETLAGSAVALHGALTGRDLQLPERLVAGLTGAAYLGVGVVGLWAGPSRVASWLQRRPRRALVASAVPLLLVAPSGGARTPLYRLVTVGVATAGGLRGRARDAQLQALLAGLAWTAGSVAARAPRGRWREHLSVTMSLVIASRVGATASQVAYDSRNLFDQLFEFTYERDDLDAYVARLRTALLDMREALVDAVSAEPRDGVKRDVVFDQAMASLGRLEERLGVLDVAGRSKFDLEGQLQAIRPMITREAALRQLGPSAVTGAAELRVMLRDRACVLTSAARRAPDPSVVVDEGVEVRGLQRLALIGATVTAATTNAVRHADGMSSLDIHLSRRGEDLVLEVVNDGRPSAGAAGSPHPRSGLAHLRRQIEDFAGTTPVFAPLPRGGYHVRVVLPHEAEPPQFEFWAAEIRRQIELGLERSTRFAAVKPAATVLGVRRDEPGAGRCRRAHVGGRRTVAPLVLALLPAVAEVVGKTRGLRKHTIDLEATALTAAAALNYRAARKGRGLATTWVSAFASRYAFHASPDAWRGWNPLTIARAAVTARSQQRAYALAALNVGAVLAALRDTEKSWDRDILSVGLAPLLTCAIVNPAQPRMQRLDRAINERLAQMESLHELADSFHADHPARPTIVDLTDLLADPDLVRRLREGVAAIDHAEGALALGQRTPRLEVGSGEPLEKLGARLTRPGSRMRDHRLVKRIWPEPATYAGPSDATDDAKLGEYLARALARRVWPARIRLGFDEDTMDYAPESAITSAAFRRQAVAAMDIVARELSREFGRGLDGMWLLRRVDLELSVVPYTGTIDCLIVPWAPVPARWRRGVDALHDLIAHIPLSGAAEDRKAEVRELLGEVEASLVDWDMFDPDELDLSDVIHPPAKRRPYPSVRRGKVILRLHPQRYSPERIEFARHVAALSRAA